MILLISNTNDLTTDFVVREISKRKLKFARLNTDEFPVHGTGTFKIGSSEVPFREILWENREKALDFNEVTSVLYRRPIPPTVDEDVTDQAVRKFCIDESYEFLRGIWYSLDVYWMSKPESIRVAEHKIPQLCLAEKLGFRIPRTVVTNNPSHVLELFESSQTGIIVKPLYIGFIDDKTAPKNIFTSMVTREHLEDPGSIRIAPSIFQEKINKEFDLRITVVGERVFCAKIVSDSLPAEMPDWRILTVDQLKHSVYQLPSDIEKKCMELVQNLDLEFGAIDMAVDSNGDYVFFEINPNGQWAWLETVLDFPISAAIVDKLSQYV